MGKKAPTEDDIVISYMGESMTMRELKDLRTEGGINWISEGDNHPRDTTSPQPRRTILTEAADIIDGARKQTYGDVTESFGRIAGLWTAYLGHEVTSLDVANLMILLKMSRTKGTFHRDSYVDTAGYAALAERLAGE